ncbi:MAG: hypothetical protein DRO62_02150 [Candidatus Altiarchaeales archaeon]|nr:MAG: hypothetical protein DRO62_02150 [Candidatus Altiarchaeales archaeon]
MTLGDLQTQFQALLPDYPYSSYEATVLQWFNMAQNAIAEEEVIDEIAVSTSTVDEEIMMLPDDYIKAKRDGLYYDDDLVEVISISEAISKYGTDWKSEGSGTPLFAVDDGSALIFVPKIDTAGKTIEMHYWSKANDLSSASDYPFTTGSGDSIDYHHNLRSLDSLLLSYALAMGEYALGKHSTIGEALTPFYALLKEKIAKIRQNPNFERQMFGLDRMYSKRLKNRHGIS